MTGHLKCQLANIFVFKWVASQYKLHCGIDFMASSVWQGKATPPLCLHLSISGRQAFKPNSDVVESVGLSMNVHLPLCK